MYRYKNTLFFTNTKTFFYIIDFYMNKIFFLVIGEKYFTFFSIFFQKNSRSGGLSDFLSFIRICNPNFGV